MTDGPNQAYPFQLNGDQGYANPPGAIGFDAVGVAITSLLRTRGDIDLNLNRLPTINDAIVQPTDPIVPYDAFVVSCSGTPISGVAGESTMNVGDYLVYISGDPTVATNWFAWANVLPFNIGTAAMPSPSPLTNAAPTGVANSKWVRVINEHLPFFP